jgi:hypothetical protein
MAAAQTIIDRVYADNLQLVELLKKNNEISLITVAEAHFRKGLVLSAASFFEARIREIILDFVKTKSNNCNEISCFVRNKAIERQYHTYFDWKSASNANSFLGLFGDDFKSAVAYAIDKDSNLKDGMQAFLYLGQTRNTLVHENFASFPLEQSSSEIYDLYKKALRFVDYLESRFLN